jgi:hypothetical protein
MAHWPRACVERQYRTRATRSTAVDPFPVSEGDYVERNQRPISRHGGGGKVPTTGTQSEPTSQSLPPLVQPSLPSDQPSVPPEIPVTDDPTDEIPPLSTRDEDSDSDDDPDEDEEENQNPTVTTRSGRRVRPPNRMNLNAMKVKELNARKSNNAKDLRKKLSSQKVRAGVLNHQFMSSVKWTQLKSCMLTEQLGKLLGNLHQETDHELDTVENFNPSIFAAKANSEDTPTYEEAINGPFAQDFRKSMEVEWDMLDTVMKAWEIVERQSWTNVLPST